MLCVEGKRAHLSTTIWIQRCDVTLGLSHVAGILWDLDVIYGGGGTAWWSGCPEQSVGRPEIDFTLSLLLKVLAFTLKEIVGFFSLGVINKKSKKE